MKDFNFKIEKRDSLVCNLESFDLAYNLDFYNFLKKYQTTLKLDESDNYAVNAFYFSEKHQRYSMDLDVLFSDLNYNEMLKLTGGKINAKVSMQCFLSPVHIFKSNDDCLKWFSKKYFESNKNNNHSKLIIYIVESQDFIDLNKDSHVSNTLNKLFLLCNEFVSFEEQIIERKNNLFKDNK